MRPVRIAFTLLSAGLLAAGCDDPTPPEPAAQVESVVVTPLGGPIFREITIRLDRPAQVRVDYRADEPAPLRIFSAGADTVHTLLLPRLRAGRSYTAEVRPLRGNGTAVEGEAVAFDTGPLPDSLADFEFTVTGTPTLPITMFEVWFTASDWKGLLAVDREGEIVWYWPTTGSLGGIRRRANGNWVVLDGDSIVELTARREVVRSLPAAGDYGTIHHDLETTSQNTVLFLARDPATFDGRTIVGEAIWEWVPGGGAVAKRWSSWDHFEWPADSGRSSAEENWFHANSLSIGERGNIVVSARNMDEVFSIAPGFGSIEWRLGGPRPTATLSEDDRFWSQHSAIDIGNGEIMLFDNGFGRPSGSYSRVLHFDIEGASATLLDSFRPTPDNRAIRVGSVRLLENGHTVATFGWGEPDPVEVFELDENLDVVWRMLAGPAMQRAYRGTPWPSIGGEEEVNEFVLLAED